MTSFIQTTIPAATQIAHIMETFDFARVQEAMCLLDWYWHDTRSTPSIKDLRQTAARLLESIDRSNPYISTGGFTATVDVWGGYNLAFCIAEAGGNTDIS